MIEQMCFDTEKGVIIGTGNCKVENPCHTCRKCRHRETRSIQRGNWELPEEYWHQYCTVKHIPVDNGMMEQPFACSYYETEPDKPLNTKASVEAYRCTT